MKNVAKKLPINLSQFDEEGTTGDLSTENYVDDSGSFNLDEFSKAFAASWKEDDTESETTEEEQEEEQTVEDETSENPEEDSQEQENSSDEEMEEPEEEQNQEQEQQDSKQNQAFARMRKELESEKKLSSFVKQIAEQQGVSPEELMNAYEERRLEAEAKEQNVPVDVLKRIRSLEEENTTAKKQAFNERFNREVSEVQNKYNLDQEGMDEVFRFMAENGYANQDGTTNISFEDAYILSNKDSFLEKAKEDGRQEYLKEKKKKQQKAAPDTGNSGGGTAKQQDGTFTTDDVKKQFAEFGIDFD